MAAGDRCVSASRLNAAGWVLGALDPEDAARFTRHLRACRRCQLTVTELEPTGRLLVMNSPAVRIPAQLKAATITRVRQAAGRQ